MSCSMKFSPRRQEGFLLSDREQTERFWSFLRKSSLITKEQTPSHRLDMLGMAIEHYATKKFHNIEKSLLERLKKAQETSHMAEENIQELLYNIAVTDYEHPVASSEVGQQWREDEGIMLLQKYALKSKSKATWEEKYVLELVREDILRKQIDPPNSDRTVDIVTLRSKLQKVDKVLKQVEQCHGIKKRWHHGQEEFINHMRTLENKQKMTMLTKIRSLAVEKAFHQGLLKKYSEGQAIGGRILRQLKRISGALSKVVKSYNDQSFKSTGSLLPNNLTLQEVSNPQCNIFLLLEQELSLLDAPVYPAANQITNNIRRQIVQLSYVKGRAIEEKHSIEKEISNSFHYFKTKYEKLHEKYENNDVDSRHSRGAAAVTITKLIQLECRLLNMQGLFSKINVPLPEFQCYYYSFESIDQDDVEWTEEEENMLQVLEDAEDELEEDDIDCIQT